MKVSIFGSCYTRELFNYSQNHEVNCYVLQQSLFTLFSNPLPLRLEDARSVDNTNFMNRMMYYEFNKLGLKSVLESESDKLVIDFADCRYDIYEIENVEGSRIIYTHDARATFDNIATIESYPKLQKRYLSVVEEISNKELNNIVKTFCEEILKKYKPEDVILIKMKMAKWYYEKNEKTIFQNNFHLSREKFINKIEKLFLKYMPDCKTLKTKFLPIANINHRFGGPHPLHFEDVYYQYKMNLLDDLLNNKNNQIKIEEDYKKTLSTQRKEIIAKEHLKSLDCKSAKRVD